MQANLVFGDLMLVFIVTENLSSFTVVYKLQLYFPDNYTIVWLSTFILFFFQRPTPETARVKGHVLFTFTNRPGLAGISRCHLKSCYLVTVCKAQPKHNRILVLLERRYPLLPGPGHGSAAHPLHGQQLCVVHLHLVI